ncbi:MAG: hypothetical protein V7K77_21280 [Nostoc sp.]|uniref:hypothetical protein n=1 Tax=Nostoc sp. TaxID=1180 RepID=UPI002FFBB86A
MTHPQISFQVRINERATIAEMGVRVGKALQCNFTTSDTKFFEDSEVLEATSLGLSIILSHDIEVQEDENHKYYLMGSLKGDLEAMWDVEYPIINISEYILGVLTKYDQGEWYIPDFKELHLEAGLSFSN